MKKQPLIDKLHSKNYTKHGFDINSFVSIASAVLVLCFILFTVIWPDVASNAFTYINKIFNTNFNWLFVLTINLAFLFLIIAAFSKYGKIKLGGFTSKPEYNNFSWYAMIFSAGIGIGIFFYGVAEPIYHMNLPDAITSGSQYDNFRTMFMHWGIHAWALYGLVAIGLGFFSYNKKLPFSFRSLFYPLIKDKIYGFWGNLIDTISVLAVLFGLATSLGLGAQQINAGLNYVFGISINSVVQIVLIAIITFIATLSVISGISKGIKFLSKVNVLISGVLLVLILLIGPTIYILSTYISSVGVYINEFFNTGFFSAVAPEDVAWQGKWTIFYWAWWISWTPFVGTFIAKISKGRTIRQIVINIIFVPTLIITFAMTILGATGMFLDSANNGVIADAINNNIAISIFEMFSYITGSEVIRIILSVIAIIVIIIFFITSSDSGSIVVDSLTSGGKLKTPKKQKVFWAVMEGAIAAAVLLLGGKAALTALQSAVIITGLPFGILLIIMMFSLTKEFKKSYQKYKFNSTLKLKRDLDKLGNDIDYKV